MIRINFTNVICKNCEGFAGFAERSKHQDKYKLYCSECRKFIKFASTEQKVIIKAREAYVREHGE